MPSLPLILALLAGLAIAAAQSPAPAAWQSGSAYAVGALVSDQNRVYKCLQAHTAQIGWEPHSQPALWQALTAAPDFEGAAPAPAPATAAPTSTPNTASPTASPATATPAANGSSGCGWQGQGSVLAVAPGLELCLPPVVCTSETCPPGLGRCVNGKCEFQGGYRGLQTEPQAWSTYYCTLSTGGCHGVTQLEFPEVTAGKVAAALAFPLCEGYTGNGTCIGIAASNPMVVGNSQVATDPSTGKLVSNWGLGLTEASGLCYAVTGPGGTAVVALTDRCGGYCKCGGSGYQECGPCVSAPDMQPNCPCVGTVPGLYSQCCGNGCPTLDGACDWCASNTHPHFDLDTGAFERVCGSAGLAGSCRLSAVSPVPCLPQSPDWPPGSASGSGSGAAGGAAGCPAKQFDCGGQAPVPEQPVVPGTSCCCSWGLTPQADGSCQ